MITHRPDRLHRTGAVVILALLALAGCGGPDFTIGPTPFYLEKGVQPWPDLRSAVLAMQDGGPEAAFDLPVFLIHELPEPYACLYYPSQREIRATITGWAVRGGSLPHELAHSWDHTENGITSLEHGDSFYLRYRILLSRMELP